MKHTIVAGDTLSKLALLYYGDSKYVKAISSSNKLLPDSTLVIGKVLYIPDDVHSLTDRKESINGKAILYFSNVKAAKIEPEIMLYSPLRGQYLVIANSQSVDDLIAEFKENIAFSEKIAAVRDTTNTNTQLADAAKLKELAESHFDGVEISAGDAIEELYLVKKNKKFGELGKDRGYIRPYKIKKNQKIEGCWVSAGDATLQKKLDHLTKPDGDKQYSADFSADLTKELFKKDFETQKYEWRIAPKKGEEPGHDSAVFDGSYEASFFRFAAGAGAKAGVDFAKKEIKVGAEGKISFSLAEGKASGTWSLPNKDGINLFSLFKNGKAKDFVVANRQCNLRFDIELAGHAFAGAAIEGSLTLPNIDFTPESMKKDRQKQGSVMSASAGIGGFAGGSAGGTLGCSLKWSMSKGVTFDSLGKIEGALDGRAGIGAELKFSITYENGTFKFFLLGGIVAGFGGKAALAFELGLEPGIDMLLHILVSVNYHYVYEIGESAFNAVRAYALVQLTNTTKIPAHLVGAAIEEAMNFGGWLANRQRAIKAAKNAIRQQIQNAELLRLVPPEAMAQSIITLMQTKEDDDYPAILKILQSAQTEHELKWILRQVSQMTLPRKGNQGEYDRLSGVALQSGIHRLFDFGNDNKDFTQSLNDLLESKGIKNAP